MSVGLLHLRQGNPEKDSEEQKNPTRGQPCDEIPEIFH